MGDKKTDQLPAGTLPILLTHTVYLAPAGSNTFSRFDLTDLAALLFSLIAPQSFASAAGPFTLSTAARLKTVYFDGLLQPASNYTLTSTTLTLAGGVDHTLFDTITVL